MSVAVGQAIRVRLSRLKFVNAISNGASYATAARRAGSTAKTRESLAQVGCHLMRDPRVIRLVQARNADTEADWAASLASQRRIVRSRKGDKTVTNIDRNKSSEFFGRVLGKFVQRTETRIEHVLSFKGVRGLDEDDDVPAPQLAAPVRMPTIIDAVLERRTHVEAE